MSFLANGTVIPFGLLGIDPNAAMRGFNKTYKNTTLRMGVVMDSYSINDSHNVSGLTTEYNVVVNEPDENGGVAAITYKNCLTVDALGSIADFFEKNFRAQTKDSVTGNIPNTKGQNGAIVLLLCLDAMSEKGIILGGINHPDRTTNLIDSSPALQGQYNGVNIKVNPDGSTSLTFMGATDNYGKPLDSSQGNTKLSIEKDGSYQVSHKTITQRFDKTSGVASLTAKSDITNTSQQGDFNISASSGNFNVNVGNSINLNAAQLVGTITGSAALTCSSGSLSASGQFVIKGATIQIQAQGLIQMQAPVIIFDGICNLGGAGGTPVLLLQTMMVGTGNLGQAVVSRAVSGFANKVYGQ